MPAWSLNSAWANSVHADLNIRGDHSHQGCDVDVSEDVDHDQDEDLYAVDSDEDMS